MIKFSTRSGTLTAKYLENWIELDFPRLDPVPDEIRHKDIEDALSVGVERIAKVNGRYLVELENERTLRVLSPNFQLMNEMKIVEIIATTNQTDSQYDFMSRVFAPGFGINEDPVTGSAHCALAPYWNKRLHKNDFIAYQASKRGGVIKMHLEKDRVYLQGQAVMVMKSTLL